MTAARLHNPTGRNTKARVVEIGPHAFYFSYETCIAYAGPLGRARRANVWGPTTADTSARWGVAASRSSSPRSWRPWWCALSRPSRSEEQSTERRRRASAAPFTDKATRHLKGAAPARDHAGVWVRLPPFPTLRAAKPALDAALKLSLGGTIRALSSPFHAHQGCNFACERGRFSWFKSPSSHWISLVFFATASTSSPRGIPPPRMLRKPTGS